MRLFLYEFVTGGGWLHYDSAVPASLRQEAIAMLTALATDLAAIANVQVEIMLDATQPTPAIPGLTVHPVARSSAELGTLEELAAACDATLLIAPEFDDHLLTRTRLAERVGARLLSPSSQVVALAADKHATAEHLARRGVPVPPGIALSVGESLPADFTYPAILKPRTGAGSLGIRRIDRAGTTQTAEDQPARLERYVPGLPASVACLCGPHEIVPLEPCLQQLAGEQDFSYHGGSTPIDPGLALRARRLALQAVRTLPNPLGYLGVDLVLGSDRAGSGDVVIEINPRLTTSYVGLRALSQGNLAQAMIGVAEGRGVELCWKTAVVTFSTTGSAVLSQVANA